MTYELQFVPSAKKEWDKLDNSVKQMLKKALIKRLENPFVSSAQLQNLPITCYKIKLRASGYRLIYTVEDETFILLVLTIDRRDVVYEKLNELLT